MRLTKLTGQAIRILVDCARADGQLIKVARLSEQLGITRQNVFKIVHLLSRAGFVACTRGPTGGVKLARAAANIRIGDVVRTMEETRVSIDRDMARNARSGASDTAVNAVFSDALAAFIQVLDAHTLAELAAAHRGDTAPLAERGKAGAKPARQAKPPRRDEKRVARNK